MTSCNQLTTYNSGGIVATLASPIFTREARTGYFLTGHFRAAPRPGSFLSSPAPSSLTPARTRAINPAQGTFFFRHLFSKGNLRDVDGLLTPSRLSTQLPRPTITLACDLLVRS
jgi:hypothetical protein